MGFSIIFRRVRRVGGKGADTLTPTLSQGERES